MLNELSEKIHAGNKEKGFYDGAPRSALEYHMLIVSEIAEATEEVRKGGNSAEIYYDDSNPTKPEGEPVEIVDALIRILDYAAYKRWDIDFILKEKLAYNSTRSYRHGGKVL
jgi:hypothetical protein